MSTVDLVAAVDRFNDLPEGRLKPLLHRCVAAQSWVDALTAGRPYRHAEQLYAAGYALCLGLTTAQVDEALADHPRIGDRPAADSRTASWSKAEQSGVDGADADLAADLLAANVEYQHRFGRIYLVCAAGRGGRELLADLRTRLANSPGTELDVVRRELGKIAQRRLATVLAEVTAE